MPLPTPLRQDAPVVVRAPEGGTPPSADAAVGRRARFAGWWTAAAPWVLAGILSLALYLAYFAYDLLQNRLLDSSARFEVATRRFERYWTLHDAARESTLAIKWGLSSPGGVPGRRELDAAIARFDRDAAALEADVAQPGILRLSQAGGYEAAVQRLRAVLSRLEPDAGASPALDAARARAQAVLDRLAAIGQEARQRQASPTAFRDDVEAVRRQVLLAFGGVVAMLALVVAVAVQWVIVARRERVIRDRAEHLAEVAEAERTRAENVMRDKSRFLGMLSHELLTPLQSIWSTMDVIESRGRVDAREPAFTRLRDSTRSLRARIGDLVDFAKVSSGRLETRIRGFQLDKLVDAALRGFEETLAAKNLDVHWEAGPELEERVFSDPARLRQIIDNVLSNAVKYTERGGITIQAEIDRAAGILRLEIADTGVGIPAHELGRLFEPFYRVGSTALMAEGSGLGLAVVRSLVDLMGGSIRYQSVVGQGTTVFLEVPIAESADPVAEAPPPRLDRSRPVLVVDDSPDARRAIADVIRAQGLEVVEAGGGEAGLVEAALRDYLAIVLDLQMPDLSGDEVARRLRRAGGRHENTCLVLVSACNDLDAATAEALFDACLDKPVGREELVALLARAAQTSRG